MHKVNAEDSSYTLLNSQHYHAGNLPPQNYNTIVSILLLKYCSHEFLLGDSNLFFFTLWNNSLKSETKSNKDSYMQIENNYEEAK